jgi:transposase
MYRGRTAKQGDKYLRTTVVKSAQAPMCLNPSFTYFYEKIKAKKGHNVAIVAVAHKLVERAHFHGCQVRVKV